MNGSCEIEERPLQREKKKSEMNENDLFTEESRLFEQLCSTLTLSIAFKQVKKNKGKPGIRLHGSRR